MAAQGVSKRRLAGLSIDGAVMRIAVGGMHGISPRRASNFRPNSHSKDIQPFGHLARVMRRRYQFFVSSTLLDLMEERRAILEVLLRRNHVPIGMELFAAQGDSAWPLIEGVMRRSDYYLLILGARYGSLDRSGLGYTEREYRFARTIGKPVIALLHAQPEKLARTRGYVKPQGRGKLARFRRHVEEACAHCGYWESAGDLPRVFQSVFESVRRAHPAPGWIRAPAVPRRARA